MQVKFPRGSNLAVLLYYKSLLYYKTIVILLQDLLEIVSGIKNFLSTDVVEITSKGEKRQVGKGKLD